MRNKDLWHYPRTELAAQIVDMFDSGLSSSLIFFAPRRMGKTEFLRKDIMPEALARGWRVFYFSFLDTGDHPALQFKEALEKFLAQQGLVHKAKKVLKTVSKVSGGFGRVKAHVEFDKNKTNLDIKELLETLTLKSKTLLLMDEVQVLTKGSHNDAFVASFRTALDMYKDHLKVIFTGSSQAGLRRMFSEARAPFFHFGQNLDFPELDKKFTDHLAVAFSLVTSRKINKDDLWQAFIAMQKVPLLARSLVERMVLNPSLDMAEVKQALIEEIFSNREFEEQWLSFSLLEQLILRELALAHGQLFSQKIRAKFARNIGLKDISVTVMQGGVKKLLRKGVIGRNSSKSGYFIDDPNFKNWLLQEAKNKDS